MNVVFRTDASLTIGTGHVMRCLTLASALRECGVTVSFICREHKGHLCGMIEEKGFTVIRLPATEVNFQFEDTLSHEVWLGAAWKVDADQTTAMIKNMSTKPNWLVVDHYAVDRRWESALRCATKYILVIDDLADRLHDCDVLLDQNLYSNMYNRYTDKVSMNCTLLLGPCYALVRKEFHELRESMKIKEGDVKKVLVLLGGVDSDNCTEKAINAIAQLQKQSLNVDVVVGEKHPALEEIKKLCERYKYQCYVQTPNVAELMAKADLAIGACGSTSWERCCLGLPTIGLTQAYNQVGIAEGLHACGALLNLGDSSKVNVKDLSDALSGMIAYPEKLTAQSLVSSRLVDGKGAYRVCKTMLKAA